MGILYGGLSLYMCRYMYKTELVREEAKECAAGSRDCPPKAEAIAIDLRRSVKLKNTFQQTYAEHKHMQLRVYGSMRRHGYHQHTVCATTIGTYNIVALIYVCPTSSMRT